MKILFVLCLYLIAALFPHNTFAQEIKPSAWLNHPRVADRSEPYLFEYVPKDSPNVIALIAQGTSLGMLGTVFLRKKDGCTPKAEGRELRPIASLNHPKISGDFHAYVFEYKTKCAPVQTVLITYSLQDFELDMKVIPK